MTQNACIIYMSRTQDIPLLYRSLVLLGKNFPKLKEYPVLVFHDDITIGNQTNLIVQVAQALGWFLKIKFVPLTFTTPEGLEPDKFLVPLSDAWIGYRHMCRFQSGLIYQHPELQQYDWYWRLDSDSYILSPLAYDPFEKMAAEGKEYAYMDIEDMDAERVTVDLWSTTKNFLESNNIPMSDSLKNRLVNGEWDRSCYYTNFEISSFKMWRSEAYQNYFKHLDSTGKFFSHRWGDAPIHWLGVKMFLDDSKVMRVQDICYQHNMWIRNVSSIPNKKLEPWIVELLDGWRKERAKQAVERYVSGGPDYMGWGDK